MTHAEQAERRKAIAEAVAAGKKPAVIAKQFNVALSTVCAACQVHRVPLPSTVFQEARHKRNAKIAAAASAGATMSQLRKRFHVGHHAVSDACREHDVTLVRSPYRPQERLFEVDPLEVLAGLKAPGKVTDAQVGRDCGLSRERVRQIKQRARKLGLL